MGMASFTPNRGFRDLVIMQNCVEELVIWQILLNVYNDKIISLHK
jgi:hypothetical protein